MPPSEELTEKCALCGKAITDSEYVVNWASCAECFDKHYQEYLDSPEGKEWEALYAKR